MRGERGEVRGMKKGLYLWAGLLVLVLVLQLVPVDSLLFAKKVVPLVWQCCYLIIAATSLNLVVGCLGQLSLGHCGFMAIGAYTSALLSLWAQRAGVFSHKESVTYIVVVLISIAAGGLLAGLVGLAVGIPALRLKGDYLAIITLGFGMIVVNLINNLPFAGMDGLSLGSAASGLYKTGLGFSNRLLVKYLWIALLGTIGAMTLMFKFMKSRFGRNVRAIRDDEIGAAACGINVPAYKVGTFALSACLGGVAGGIYACFMSALTTSSFAFTNNGILNSTFLVAMCVLGGLGSLSGSAVAATIMCLLNYLISQTRLNSLPGWIGLAFSYPMLIYAVVLVVIIIFMPGGLTGGREISLKAVICKIGARSK